MGQALYRKYRSKSLDEVVGQEHITETLARALKTGRISHAYLFTGPHGVGKTSVARILAHQLNDTPYTGEDSQLDIVEIDAASSGGVDEVRDLREKIYTTPTNGKYKVYIIDEIHMMTTAAFNALLKTLEEPPAHVIFILATTETHKLPATIISRTQRFTFKPVPRDKIIEHLRFIAKSEKINIDDDALRLLASYSEGSFRDSIGMLDQASGLHEHIDRALLERLLGIPAATAIQDIITEIHENDVRSLITSLSALRLGGYQAAAIAKQLAGVLRSRLVDESDSLDKQKSIKILSRLIDVPASHNPDQLLELILLESVLGDTVPSAAAVKAPAANDESAHSNKGPKEPSKPTSGAPSKPVKAATSPKPSSSSTIDAKQWQEALQALKKQYNTLYGIVRMAQPKFLPGKVELAFGFAFHQKRASDVKNKNQLVGVLSDITGQTLAVECLLDKEIIAPPSEATPEPEEPADASSLNTISNIFGGGELLKS